MSDEKYQRRKRDVNDELGSGYPHLFPVCGTGGGNLTIATWQAVCYFVPVSREVEELKGEAVILRSTWVVVLWMAVLMAGCKDRVPIANVPAGVKGVTFEVVARGNRCEPSVPAVDREGGAILITFQVTSVGKKHVFLISDLDVRMTVPEGMMVSIPVLADRSGIYDYACTGPWIGLFTAKGKLAIK